MYNETSGSMYEAEEEQKQKTIRHKKIVRRRIITISVLSLVLVYCILLLIDINRYKNGQNPLITVANVKKEYDDGYVITKTSIGWVFRDYQRETIVDSEMVPIWAPIRMDNVLNRQNDPDLPEINTDYEIPANPLFNTQVDDVLFFYDGKDEEENPILLTTYQCLNTYCEIAISANFEFDEDHYQSITMGINDSRYAFITEYKNKDTEAEEKYVYLFDIVANRLIAKYDDVRYAKINDKLGYIDSSKYIVKKNGKWGIDQVIKGKVTNLENYSHEALYFDTNSNLYVFYDANEFQIYNSETKEKTAKVTEPISEIYQIDNKPYIKTYIESAGWASIKYYKLYNEEGTNLVDQDNALYLNVYDKFFVYIKDNNLYFLKFDGTKAIDSPIPLYFNDYYQTSLGIAAFYINVTGDTLKISTPKTKEKSHYTDEFYYNTSTWEQIRVRKNVKETLELNN